MKKTYIGFMFLLAAAWMAFAAAPTGWFLAGSKPANYDTGLDPASSFAGFPSAYLKSKGDSQDGFGTLMQGFAATNYLGKRIRLSAYVKSQDVTRSAGLWMRVDGKGEQAKVLSFDNMGDRPIKGTTGWQRYEVVLDVPDSAVDIAFGMLLNGPGEIWLNSADIESVSTSVPITSHTPSAPSNEPTNIRFTVK